ncbi:MAG: hypothetical protein HQK59_16730 [Deltaproteobacteria bacterium]|nr:hypothetical protein [Deltaproteobacteria bacterium]
MKLFNVKLLLVLVGVGLLFLGLASVSFAEDKATEDAIKNSATHPERDVVVPPKPVQEKDNPDITKAASHPERDVQVPPKGASTSKEKSKPAKQSGPESE